MLSDYAFYLDWNDLPVEWRKEKIEEVRENLIEQEKGHYAAEAEDELDMAEEEYLRNEVWNRDNVESHIKNHFPIYF